MPDAPAPLLPLPAAPPSPLVLAGVLATALVAQEYLGEGPGGVQYLMVAALAAATAVAAGIQARRTPSPSTWVLGGLAVALSAVPALTDSADHASLAVLTGYGCLLWAATGGRMWVSLVLAGPVLVLAAAKSLPWVGGLRRHVPGRTPSWSLVRGVAGAVVLVGVAGALLGAADPAFAHLFALLGPGGLDRPGPRTVILVISAWVVLAAAYGMASPTRWETLTVRRGSGPLTEWGLPLLGADLLLGLFLTVQVVEWLRPGTLAPGETFADRVHEGFGQLVAVTLLMGVVLAWTGRRCAVDVARDRRVLVGLGGLLVLLVVGLGLVALQRMWDYEQAYGWTPLRLDAAAFELWLLLVLIGAAVLWLLRHQRLIPTFVVSIGALAMLLVCLARPEAVAAAANADRLERTGEIDLGYLTTLSDDVVPVLADLPEPYRSCGLLQVDLDGGYLVFVSESPTDRSPEPWASANLARWRADRIMATADVSACDAATFRDLLGEGRVYPVEDGS